ncbi:MAG: GNAT family N-acetyltransferase [Acidobacteriota bacterium]
MSNPNISSCSSTTEPTHEPITLRLATPSDAGLLALVSAATFLEAFTWLLPGADILAHCTTNLTPEAYAHYLASPRTRITLATAGADVPVGLAMVCTPDLPSFDVQPTDLELKRIYLFSRFRSSSTLVTNHPGIKPAQALMDSAIQDAADLGATRLLLGTHETNLRAIAFYKRNGFTEAGHRTFQVGTQSCCDLLFARPV